MYAYATRWECEYDRTTQESAIAAQVVAAKGVHRTWPAAGLNVPTTWNPNGYPMVKAPGVVTVTQNS